MELEVYDKLIESSQNRDELFTLFFQTVRDLSGPVWGTSYLTQWNGEVECETVRLGLAGRFGSPTVDPKKFCQYLSEPTVGNLVHSGKRFSIIPEVVPTDFNPDIQKYLVGVTTLAVALQQGENTPSYGVIVLYRKGEQPITDEDVKLVFRLILPVVGVLSKWHDEDGETPFDLDDEF